MIDLGTEPLGHTLSSIELDADRIEYLLDTLTVAELPVVLDLVPGHDSATERTQAVRRGEKGLIADGLLPDGRVHRDIEAWVRILEQPQWYVSARGVSRPYDETAPMVRLCVATSHIGSVTAVRSAQSLVLAATRTVPGDVLDALGAQAYDFAGQAFDFASIAAPTDLLAEALDAAPSDPTATAARLAHIGVDADAARQVASAMSTCIAHAEITSVTVDAGVRRAGPHPVAFFDTTRGRILATSQTASDGTRWTSLSPGSDARVLSALSELAAATRDVRAS